MSLRLRGERPIIVLDNQDVVQRTDFEILQSDSNGYTVPGEKSFKNGQSSFASHSWGPSHGNSCGHV
jgi:hypothetical protein